MSLTNPILHNADAVRAHLEVIRSAEGVYCPNWGISYLMPFAVPLASASPTITLTKPLTPKQKGGCSSSAAGAPKLDLRSFSLTDSCLGFGWGGEGAADGIVAAQSYIVFIAIHQVRILPWRYQKSRSRR